MGVGYQKFQAGSPDGYLDFGVISTPAAGKEAVDTCNFIEGRLFSRHRFQCLFPVLPRKDSGEAEYMENLH